MSIAIGGHSINPTAGGTTAASPAVTTQVSGSTFVLSIGYLTADGLPTTIADTFLNTYTKINTEVDSGTGYSHVSYYCQNGVGGNSHIVTATWAGAGLRLIAFVEITGGAISGILDQSPAIFFDNSSPFTSNTTGTTTQANELIYSFTVTGSVSGAETLTWGNSFIALDDAPDAARITGGNAYLIASSTGTFQSSFTSTGASTTDALTSIYTFKEFTNSGPGTPIFSPLNGTSYVPVNVIPSMTFSVNVQAGTGNIILKDDTSSTTVQTFNVTDTSRVIISSGTVTIIPDAFLTDFHTYHFEVNSGAIQKASDSTDWPGINNSTTWFFTTGGAFIPIMWLTS
jgi:hypothetical protein